LFLTARTVETRKYAVWAPCRVFMHVLKIAESDDLLRHACLSVYPSVRLSAWNNSAPTGQISIKFNIWVFFENLSRKFKFHKNRTILTGTLHEYQYTFLIITPSFLLRIRNASEKRSWKNQNTYFMKNNFILQSRAVYQIKWKNIVEPDIPQTTIWCIGIACWIPKATNSHSDFVVLIAFQLQQWLHESFSLLHYTYIVCLDNTMQFLHFVINVF
jgi:hypothetical protein